MIDAIRKHLVLGPALIAALILAMPAWAQEAEKVSRPKFQHAMGLLTTEEMQVGGADVPLGFVADVPSSNEVTARVEYDVEGALALVEFAAPGNSFLETVIFTHATVEAGDDQTRAFGLANLLVLRAFGDLKRQFDDAKIIGFSPLEIGPHKAVHVVGTYTHDQLGPTVFRHVGLMPEGRPDVLLALINISAVRMPSRNTSQLDDTYTGWLLQSLTFDE